MSTASDDVTLAIIEGADHIHNVLTEDQTLAEQAIATTADWYAENLQDVRSARVSGAR